jgi:hypothetical protein
VTLNWNLLRSGAISVEDGGIGIWFGLLTGG